MIHVGQNAPSFKLIDTDKKEVTLEQFKGKTLVLFFFPMAWTGVCTKEMCAIQEDYNAYSSMNAQVAGVSVDTLFALKRFGEDHKITFPLLSDFNKQAIKDYDVIHHDFAFGYKDVSRRATFVIDEDGIVRFAEVLPQLGDMPNMEAIKATVEQLNAVSA